MDMLLVFLIFAVGYLVGTFGTILALILLERTEEYFDKKKGE